MDNEPDADKDAEEAARELSRGHLTADNQIREARAREAARPQEQDFDQLTRH